MKFRHTTGTGSLIRYSTTLPGIMNSCKKAVCDGVGYFGQGYVRYVEVKLGEGFDRGRGWYRYASVRGTLDEQGKVKILIEYHDAAYKRAADILKQARQAFEDAEEDYLLLRLDASSRTTVEGKGGVR